MITGSDRREMLREFDSPRCHAKINTRTEEPIMRTQHTYRVVLTVKHADNSVSRTKAVPVRASSEERAVNALIRQIETETQKRVTETIFQRVTFA
jgi:hypothetical protein